MGVDYYNCSACGEIANDCGEHCFCDDCMNFFCGYCDEGKRLCTIELLTADECPVCLKEKEQTDHEEPK